MKRYVLIGDVHGTLHETKELIAKLVLTSDDKVIFLGDLVDKGPYPAETVQYIKDSGFDSIIGNHDLKYLKYWRHEQKRLKDPKYKNPMRLGPNKQRTYDGLLEADLLPWLSTRPMYFHLEELSVVGVHGGLVPGLTLKEQPEREMLYRRYVTPEGKFLSLDQYNKDPDSTMHWADCYTGPYKHVFYGHSVRSITKPYISEPREGIFTYGIDTGCFLPGTLVETNRGFIPIETVITGDKVQSHLAREDIVTEPTTRSYSGKIVTISFNKNLELKATEDHKLWAYKEDKIDWVAIKDLNIGDLVLQPVLSDSNSKNIEEFNGIKIDNECLELLGWYLAEGSCHLHSQTVGFCLGLHEEELANRVADLCQHVFGKRGILKPREKKSTIEIFLHLKEAKTWIQSLFPNQKAGTKSIPSWVMNLPIDKLKHLLKGLIAGDGSKKDFGRVRTIFGMSAIHWEVRYATVSHALAYQTGQIFSRLGYNFCFRRSRQKKKATAVSEPQIRFDLICTSQSAQDLAKFVWDKDSPQTPNRRNACKYITKNGITYLGRAIKTKTEQDYLGSVHCLNTKNDHSFTVDNYAVHNCVHGGCLTAAIITPAASGKDFITFKQLQGTQTYSGLKCTGEEL